MKRLLALALIFLFGICYLLNAQTLLKPAMNHYDSSMEYLPNASEIYHDSVYLEEKGIWLPFDFDTYFKRFAERGAGVMADETYYFFYEILLNMPKAQAVYYLDRMADTALELDSKELGFEAEFWRIAFMYIDNEVAVEKMIAEMQNVINAADKRGDVNLKMKAKTFILERLWEGNNPDYSLFFRYALNLIDELDDSSENVFKGNRKTCFILGNAYYYFRDYEKAEYYLKKALSDNTKFFYDRSNMRALNTLAAYFFTVGKLDSADYYSQKILNSRDMVKMRPQYDAIAIVNLGHSSNERHDYETAIKLFRQGLPTMFSSGDNSFIAGIYTGLGEAYLGEKNLHMAKQMIDSASYYIHTYNLLSRKRGLFPLMSKYYAQTGDVNTAQLYVDSTIMVNKAYEDQYNAMYLLRAEQELFETEREMKDEKIRAQQRSLVISVFIILLTCIMCLFLFWMYRKKKLAVMRLKLGRQRQNEADELERLDTSGATPEDVMVMNSIRSLVITEQIYRDPMLNAESLADRMGVTRQIVVKAIQRTQKKTVSAYINELRVQEAILVLSDDMSADIPLEALAIDCGFLDRKSFFKAFKHETGISPTDFRKNKKNSM